MGLDTFWAIFSQTNLVTLATANKSGNYYNFTTLQFYKLCLLNHRANVCSCFYLDQALKFFWKIAHLLI
jgi:hypothetical protein